MVLMVGGSFQGKTRAALGLWRRINGEKNCTVFEGKKAGEKGKTDREEFFREVSSADVVLHLESLFRFLMEQEEQPEEWGRRFLERIRKLEETDGKVRVMTADEIGCGIVPLDPFEREYRERAGRFCQRAAAQAQEVYRVLCGLEMRIK